MVDRRLRNALPIALVLVVVGVGLVLIATDHWRRGATALGAAAGLGALLRLTVPERFVGVLCVRSKTFDVLFLLALTGLLATLVWRV